MLACDVYSYLLLLLDLSAAMQYAVLNPLPIDDTDADNPIRLPPDPPRLVLDDDSAWAEGGVHRPGLPRTGAHRPERPKKGPKNGGQPLDPTDAAGAGFGAPCDVSAPCSGSLGLACIKTEELDYRCGCAEGTPVLIEESGVKKCVRAKSMYESCTSNQECSFGNPNLQCVDFLCYCPLPFVLTETRRCLAPPESPNKMIYAMAPTVVLIFALVLIGGAYTYKKVLGSGGSSQSTTSFLPLAEKVPTRRASSAIRLGRKSGASWNRQLSVAERPWKERVDVPKHPPRYIKGIHHAQKAQIPKKEQILPPEGYSPSPLKESSSAAPKPSSNDQPNHAVVTSVPPSVLSTQNVLPSPTEAIGRANSGSPTPVEALGSEQAKEDAGGRKGAPTQFQPSDEALRRILNEGEVMVNVERVSVSITEEKETSSMVDNSSRPQPKLSRVWQRPASMPLEISEPKFQNYQETTTEPPTTENQLTKKTPGKARSTVLTTGDQERIVSPGAVPTTDVAIQMDSSVTDVVDKSQKFSDLGYMVDKSQQCSDPRHTVDASQQFSDQGYVVDKSQQFSDPGHTVDASQQFSDQGYVVDKSQQFSDPGHTLDTSQQFSDQGYVVDKSQQFSDQGYVVDKSQQFSDQEYIVDTSQKFSDQGYVVDKSQPFSERGYEVNKLKQFSDPVHTVDTSQQFSDNGYAVDKSQQFSDPGYVVDESQQVSDLGYAVDKSQQFPDPGYVVDKLHQFLYSGYVVDKSQEVSNPPDLGNEVDMSQFSDPSNIGSESEAHARARKLIKETEIKEQGARKPWKPDESPNETLGSFEPFPMEDMRKKNHEPLFTCFMAESPKSMQNSLISQLTYVRRTSPTWTQTSSHEGTDEDFMKEIHSGDKDGVSTLSAYGTTGTDSHGEASIAKAEKDSNVPSEPKIPLVIKDVPRENANQNRRSSAFAITTPEKGSRKEPDSKDNFYSMAEAGAHLYESGTKAFQGRSKGSMEPLFFSAHTVVMEESDQIRPGVQETARTQASCHVDEVGRSSEHRKKTSEKIKTPLPHSLRLPSSTCQLARLVTNRDATGKTTGGDGGKTCLPSPHGSLSSIPTLVEDCESQLARRSRHMDRGGAEQLHQVTQVTGTRVGVYPSTSSGGKSVSKGNPWGEWVSQTEETYSGGSRLDGDVQPSSHKTQSSRPHLALQQEVAATRAETTISLELGFRGDRRPWSADVTLGSMDVESSEPGRSLPRPASKHTVEITPKTTPPSDLVLMGSASNYIAKKPQKRVSFHDRIFFHGLADVKSPSSVPWKEISGPSEDDQKTYIGNDSAAEETIRYSKSQEKTAPSSSAESRKRAAEITEGITGRGEGRKQAEEEVGGEQSPPSCKKELIEGSAQRESSKAVDANLGQNIDISSTTEEPDAPPPSLSLWQSKMVSQRSTGVSRYFCGLDDEPLPPSASTALSFISSESSYNVLHNVMDLKSLHALSALAAQLRVTGEETHTVESKSLDKSLLKSRGLENSQETQSPQEETQEESRQEAETPEKQMQPLQDRAIATGLPSLSKASTERCTQDPHPKSTVRQTSSRVHCAAQPPSRSKSTERQRLSRSNVTQRRRGDDIMHVTPLGNEHYLHGRSATSPEPLSAAFITAPLLIDSQYSAELTRTASSDSIHSGISMTMDLASRKFRDAVASLPKVPLRSADSSASGGRQASPQANEMTMPPLPRTSSLPVSPVPQRPSQSTSAWPASLGSLSTEPQDAGKTTNWGPGGEQGKVNTIAEAVWEIELEDPPAVATALTAKDSYWKAVRVLSGDTIDLNSPQLAIENDADHLASNLTFEVEGESRPTPTEPNWDACSRELVKSVKMLAQAIGMPESSSKTIELPSPDDLFMSETSTLEICLDDTLPSSITDPSVSALSRARTESSKSSRNRRLSSVMPEVPCFESLYNYILESGGSLDTSTRLRPGSLDSSGLLVAPEWSSGPTSALSKFTSWSGYRKFGLAKDETSTPAMASLEPGRPAQGNRGIDSGEDCESRRINTSESEGGAPSGVTPSRTSNRRSVRLTPTSGAQLPKPTVVPLELALTDNLMFDILEDENAEAGDRSPFFSFEESASETSLGPGASDMDSPLPPRTPPPNLG